MKVFNYSEARQNFAAVLKMSQSEEVIITRRDGSRYRITPLEPRSETESPLDVESISTDITTADILQVVRESREDTAN